MNAHDWMKLAQNNFLCRKPFGAGNTMAQDR